MDTTTVVDVALPSTMVETAVQQVEITSTLIGDTDQNLEMAVFQQGNVAFGELKAEPGHGAIPPPKPVLVAAPTVAGTYPVAILLHGFHLHNNHYDVILTHMASHGFIVVAPQLYTMTTPFPNPAVEIATAAQVADWLAKGLPAILPAGVSPGLDKVALAGHSRGGYTAFALALGHAKTDVKFSALIGIDPVAGQNADNQLSPKILTSVPSSFELNMPVMVIGTGLGEEKRNWLLPPCAPEKVNHREFYYECKPPCYHLVAEEFGHNDMLDDDAPFAMTCLCKEGKGEREPMRRTVAGLVVAFLRANLQGEDADFKAILKDPSVAPAKLDPVERQEEEAK